MPSCRIFNPQVNYDIFRLAIGNGIQVQCYSETKNDYLASGNSMLDPLDLALLVSFHAPVRPPLVFRSYVIRFVLREKSLKVPSITQATYIQNITYIS